MRHALLLLLAAVLLPAQGPPDRRDYARRQANLDAIAWPSHEPLAFLRRHGGFDVETEADYFRYHTEENVRKIAATGVRMSRILHFYKGFGLAAEAEEMQRTVELARLFHKYGLKVPVYIGGTMFSETFFQETPEARKWIRTDQWGQPVTYGGHQTARYFACLNQPGYVDYIKKVLRKAVVEARADRIFFDNFTLNAEPLSCNNEACVREFRRYLERKYDAARRTERFGFADTGGVRPPLWNAANQPWQLQTITDPLLQEWIDFRCWTISHYYRQLYDYIKSLNPQVSVGVNIKGIMGRNRAFRDAIDHRRFAEIGDWFELDPGFPAGMATTGALVSEIRSYKMGQSLGVPFDFEAETELRLAEYMAFNFQKQTPGFGYNGGFQELIWVPHLFRYFDFFHDYDATYYRGARSLADVGVLRGYASMANDDGGVQRSTMLAEQVLIQHKVPFHILFDRHLEDLRNYRVLFLADQECLSDRELEGIEAWVKSGGGLVATGAAGGFDPWHRRRRTDSLAARFGFRTGQPTRGTLGKGRYVYLPAIVPTPADFPSGRHGQWDEDFNAPQWYREFSPELWLLPANDADILDAVRWAAGGRFTAEYQAPLATVAEVTRDNSGKLRLVHLLNYDSRRPARDIEVELAVPFAVRSVTLLSPDDESRRRVPHQQDSGRVRFRVEKLQTYTLAVVEP